MKLNLTDLVDRINRDPEFAIAAKLWDTRLQYTMGDRVFLLIIRDGVVVEVVENPNPFHGAVILISAPEDVWDGILAANPAPMYQDLFSAQLHLGLSLQGDTVELYTYYAAIRRITDLMRQTALAAAA